MILINLHATLPGQQFIELCILLGCDYLEPAKGIGPKTALKLMREHGSLKNIVAFVRGKMAEKVAEAGGEAPEEIVESEIEEEEKPPSPDADFGYESEDGYEKRVVADMDGDEKEMDKSRPSGSGGNKKKKVVVDSDEEDEGKARPIEKTEPKEDAGSDVEWEASPEPEPRSQKSKSPEKKPATKKKTTTTKKTTAKTSSAAASSSAPAKPKRNIKGGMQLPEYWPWEEAKKVFMKPDVTPGDDLEVSLETMTWLV